MTCNCPPLPPKAFLLTSTPKLSGSEREWVFLPLEMCHQHKQMQRNSLVMLPSPLVMFQEIMPPCADSGPMTLCSGGIGAVGWNGGRKETGSGPWVSSRVFTRHSPVDSLLLHPWLMPPTRQKDINDFHLLLFFLPCLIKLTCLSSPTTLCILDAMQK